MNCILYLIQVSGHLCIEKNDEERLIEDLFRNYTPAVRPVKDAKQPVLITLALYFSQLFDLVSVYEMVMNYIMS